MNSELIRPSVTTVKRDRVFVIQTLDKVDSAVRVTVLPGTEKSVRSDAMSNYVLTLFKNERMISLLRVFDRLKT